MPLIEQCKALFSIGNAHIEKIIIEKPLVSIEYANQTGSENNWHTILSNLVKTSAVTENSRRYHIDQILFSDIQLELKNNSKIRHPQPIKKLVMGQLKEAPSICFDTIIYGITKMMLLQIGDTLELPTFRESISSLPSLIAPFAEQENLSLVRKVRE